MATSKARRGLELADEALAAEEHAFRRKLPQLMRRYAGEFVALYQAASSDTTATTRTWRDGCSRNSATFRSTSERLTGNPPFTTSLLPSWSASPCPSTIGASPHLHLLRM